MMLTPPAPVLPCQWRGKIAAHVPVLLPLRERVACDGPLTSRRRPDLYLSKGYGRSGRTAHYGPLAGMSGGSK